MQFRSIICVVSGFLVMQIASGTDDEKVLRLFNWMEFMPEKVLEDFQKETGYQIRQIYYDSEELKDELIYATQGKGLDLMIGSRFSLMQYQEIGGILASIPDDKFPNRSNIDERWLKNSQPLKDMGVPYAWGTLGIIYRSDLVDQPVTSWRQLLQPTETHRNKIIMLDDVRDSMSAALLMLDYSINTTAPEEIMNAGQILSKQREYVRKYEYIDIDEDSELLVFDVHMTIGYSSDALHLQEYHDSIEYVIPEEGTALWADYIAVFEASENKEMAYAFINFINEPARAAFIAEELSVASANAAARKHMSQEHLTNSLIYPPETIQDNAELLQIINPRAQSLYNIIFLNISN